MFVCIYICNNNNHNNNNKHTNNYSNITCNNNNNNSQTPRPSIQARTVDTEMPFHTATQEPGAEPLTKFRGLLYMSLGFRV